MEAFPRGALVSGVAPPLFPSRFLPFAAPSLGPRDGRLHRLQRRDRGGLRRPRATSHVHVAQRTKWGRGGTDCGRRCRQLPGGSRRGRGWHVRRDTTRMRTRSCLPPPPLSATSTPSPPVPTSRRRHGAATARSGSCPLRAPGRPATSCWQAGGGLGDGAREGLGR